MRNDTAGNRYALSRAQEVTSYSPNLVVYLSKRNQIDNRVLTAYPPTLLQAKLDAPAPGYMNLCFPRSIVMIYSTVKPSRFILTSLLGGPIIRYYH
jgi:hypothetical protein